MPVPSLFSRSMIASRVFGNEDILTMPAPTGSGTDRLDLIVLCSYGDGAGSHSVSGYTQIFQHLHSTRRISAWRKSADTSPADATVTIYPSAVPFQCARWLVDNVDLADPVDVVGSTLTGSVAPASATTFPVPGVTAATNTLALTVFHWGHGWFDSPAVLPDGVYEASGWTHRASESGGNWNAGSFFVASKDMASGGATGDAVVDPISPADIAHTPAYVGVIFAINGTGGPPPAARRRQYFIGV